jgi:hypothetical protein
MNCIHCREEINPLRLKALPGTRTCVSCSTTGAKKGVIVTLGEKDHTCNEVMFLEDDQYEKYLKSQKTAKFDRIEENGDIVEPKQPIDINNLDDDQQQ